MIGGQDPEPRRAPSLLDVVHARKAELAASWHAVVMELVTRGGRELTRAEGEAVSLLVEHALGSVLSFGADSEAMLQMCEADRGRLLDVLEHGDAVCVVDRDWRIVLVNETTEQLIGLSRDVVLGQNLWELFPPSEVPDHPSWPEMQRVMRDRVRVQYESYYPPLHRWLAVVAFPTREGGVAVFLRDVSERKRVETEQRRREDLLRTVADAVSAAIYLKDREGRFLLVNRYFEEALQTRPGEVVGCTDFDVHAEPEEARRFVENDRRVLEAKEPLEFEEEVTHPDGSRHVYASVKVPLLDESGEPWAVCGISTDITERKRLTEQLGQAAEMRERLLRVVSHDLRNPLSALVLGLGTLKRRLSGLSDNLVGRVENLQRAAGRMQRLLADLLDVARAESGSLEVTVRRARADDLVREAAEAHAPLARERGVDLVVSHEISDVEVCCDPGRVEQMLANLVENALKFTPPGGCIELAARTDPGEVCFSVSDTGPGISPEVRARLFEPYVTSPSPGGAKGTGLGLFITRTLAQAQHGRVWAEDNPGGGARLCFTLPRVD